MFLLAVALYFILACLISWLVLFPVGRELVMQAMANAELRLSRRFSQLIQLKNDSVLSLRQSAVSSAHNVNNFFRRHYLICLAGAADLPAADAGADGRQ